MTSSPLPHADPAPYRVVFQRLQPFSGRVPAGFDVSLTGALNRPTWFMESSARRRNEEHASVERTETRSLPLESDVGYYELGAILLALSSATEAFSMIELGAGTAPNLLFAATASKQINPIPLRLTGVEAETQRVAWMREHFELNGLDPDAHQIIHAAAVGDDHQDPFIFFPHGTPDFPGFGVVQPEDPLMRIEWISAAKLGRPIIAKMDVGWGYGEREVMLLPVRGISLKTLITPSDKIDVIHMDIQGNERDVVQCSLDLLGATTRYLCIGTHATEIEVDLLQTLSDAKWEILSYLPHNAQFETSAGIFNLLNHDGVIVAKNLAFA